MQVIEATHGAGSYHVIRRNLTGLEWGPGERETCIAAATTMSDADAIDELEWCVMSERCVCPLGHLHPHPLADDASLSCVRIQALRDHPHWPRVAKRWGVLR